MGFHCLNFLIPSAGIIWIIFLPFDLIALSSEIVDLAWMSNNKSLHSQEVEEEFQVKQFYLIVILKKILKKMCKTLPPSSHVID